jgi:hypothetical protein
MAKKVWRKVVKKPPPAKPTEAEKVAIVAACEAFIRDVLKPRFLPEIKPTEFNYPIDIFGDWRAGRYRFLQRYRSDSFNRIRDEFDAPFARLDFMGPDRFDIYWMRHTGQWWPLHRDVTLEQALRLMIDDGHLHPL